MLIDWFTVAAQIVNFLILVWLLKHFLYGRIIRAIEARERGIAENLADAAAKEKAAGEQLALYQAKLGDLEQQQASLLAQAKTEAERQQSEMLAQAREHVRTLEEGWQQDLDRERNAFLVELRRRAGAEILALARQTVADLASVDLQRCAVQVFLEKIRSLDRDACQAFAKSELSIRTALDLPEETQVAIERALSERLEMPVTLHFEQVPGIGLGLELRGNGWRIGWSSESYLEALEQDLREVLDSSAGPSAHPIAAGAMVGSR